MVVMELWVQVEVEVVEEIQDVLPQVMAEEVVMD
jgi:hypothetical protein